MKHDALVDSAQSALGWLEEHKTEAILTVAAVIAVVAIVIGGSLFMQHRQDEASAAFGAAMDLYSAPIAQPNTPQQPGVRTYANSTVRAQAANELFVKAADSYGSTDAGKQALYFSGLTYMEMGNTAQAETTLKKTVRDGDSDLAALANLALAGLYRQTGRTPDAIKLLDHLANHPTTTVPAAESKLELADIYERTDPAQARTIYAQLKDKEPKTAAGQIAAQKLQQLH